VGLNGSASARARPAASDDDRLSAALQKIEDQGSPLQVLDAQTRAGLELELSKVSTAEREQLRLNETAAAERPLLHLFAYGVLPAAYQRLSMGEVAADEIVQARILGGARDFENAAKEVLAVAQLSARKVVRDAVSARGPGGQFDLAHLRAVVVALYTLGDLSTAELARSRLSQLDPAPVIRFALAYAYARVGKWDLAEAALLKLQADPEAGALRSTVDTTLAQVKLARSDLTEPANGALVLARARAEMQLGRLDQARAVLTPLRAQAARHLGLAVATVQADLGGELCPGMPTGMGNGALCEALWLSQQQSQSIDPLLDAAWQSGEGRDAQSIEGFLGLRFVVPLMYRHPVDPPDAKLNAVPADISENLRGLSAALAQVTDSAAQPSSSPARLRALRRFAQIVERATLDRGKISPRERAEWKAQALALQQSAPNEPATLALILGLATWLAPSEDIAPLLDAVKPDQLADRQSLDVWLKLNLGTALANGDRARLESCKNILPQWMLFPEGQSGEMLLLIAQADAALDPSNQKKWLTLLHLANAFDTVTEARLQAAATNHTLGDGAGAVRSLEQLEQDLQQGTVVRADPVGFFVTHVLRLGLAGLSAQGAARVEKANAIVAALKKSSDAVLPPQLITWAQLWVRRLREADERCPKPFCSEKLLAALPSSARLLEPHPLHLLQRGVLSLGAVGLSLNYEIAQGLQPVIAVQARYVVAGP
jgi:hypothetical protein